MERALAPGSEEARRIAAVPEGKTERIELGGGVFALEQAYVAKPANATGRLPAVLVVLSRLLQTAGQPQVQVIRNAGKQPYDGFVAPSGRYYIAGL